jgi:tRNA nucleotidyltransferase/poly(A) polymerase
MQLPIRKEVSEALRRLDGEIYIVGGTARDILLNKPQNDIDLVVIKGGYEKIAKSLAAALKRPLAYFKDNIRIDCGEYHIDVSAPRGGTIEEDLLKRDFTINPLAFSIDGALYGNTGELHGGVIPPVHNLIFSDDPIRILRGFRLALTLHFTLSEDFIILAGSYVSELKRAAVERVFSELRQIAFAEPDRRIHAEMSAVGVWKAIINAETDVDLLLEAVALINGKRYRSNDISFAIFLAAMLVNTDRADIESFKLSRNEERTASELLSAGKFILKAETPDEFKRIIWRLHTLGLVEAASDFTKLIARGALPEAYTSLLTQFSPTLAEVLTGEDIMNIFPQRRGGAWISETLTSVKIALAFGDISGRTSALILAKELAGLP